MPLCFMNIFNVIDFCLAVTGERRANFCFNIWNNVSFSCVFNVYSDLILKAFSGHNSTDLIQM